MGTLAPPKCKNNNIVFYTVLYSIGCIIFYIFIVPFISQNTVTHVNAYILHVQSRIEDRP